MAAASFFIGSCRGMGALAGASRTAATEPATAAGTDIALVDTTCSVPPAGRLSARPVASADPARAAVPVAVTTKGSR